MGRFGDGLGLSLLRFWTDFENITYPSNLLSDPQSMDAANDQCRNIDMKARATGFATLQNSSQNWWPSVSLISYECGYQVPTQATCDNLSAPYGCVSKQMAFVKVNSDPLDRHGGNCSKCI